MPTLTEVVTPAVLDSVTTPEPVVVDVAAALEKRLLIALEKDLDQRIREAVYAALGMHLPALVEQLHSQVQDTVSKCVRDSVAREMARSPDPSRKCP